MKKLFLKSLTIVSDIEKSANQFTFEKNNLILSEHNRAGKSTLIDMIFWTLGCDVSLKTDWKAADAKSLLEIESENKTHFFAKIKGEYFYKKENDTHFQKFDKVTGDFTQNILEIIGISYLKVLDKNGRLINPVPEYVLSPFYIDQSQWNSDIFSNVKSKYISKNKYDDILKAYIGYIDEDYFKRQLEIYETNEEISTLKSNNLSVENSREVLSNVYTIKEDNEKYVSLVMENNFSELINIVEEELGKLIPKKYEISSQLNNLNNDRLFYKNQLKIIEKSYRELENDYIEAVENQDIDIICPMCGVEHHNSIQARAELLADKTEVKDYFEKLEKIIIDIDNRIKDKKEKLLNVTGKIDAANELFFLEKDTEFSNLTLDKVSYFLVEKRLIDEQKKIKHEISKKNKNLRLAKADNTKILKGIDKNAIDTYFFERFSTIASTLEVFESDYQNFSSPLEYKKLEFDKGAYATRGILSLYLSLWQTMQRNQACFFPIFIDTPNQQEQDPLNYPKMINAIIDNLSDDNQIFVCALENVALDPLKSISSTIYLSNPVLLKSKYDDLKRLLRIQ